MGNTANLPQTVVQLPPMTPLQNVLRSPQEIEAHRGQISVLVDIFLDGYWQPDMSDTKRKGVLMDWCNELEDWPLESIDAALRKWRRGSPSRKPNPGHILQILKQAWSEHNAPQIEEVGRRWQAPEPSGRPALPKRIAICADLAKKFPELIKVFPEVKA